LRACIELSTERDGFERELRARIPGRVRGTIKMTLCDMVRK